MKCLDPDSDAARDLRSGRYRIRTLDAAGMAAVPIAWMREAGWNPGLHDAETFLTADPAGFLVGECDGVPVATVSAVRYDDHFGFIGCYIVAPEWRGRGYGMAIHEAARRHLQGCTQGGDGVLENVDKYRRIGREYAYRNARYEAVRAADPPAVPEAPAGSPAISVQDARTAPAPALAALDRACFPADRSAFLHAWIHQPGAHALAAVRADDGSVQGYGVIRPCFRGWKIGPLFARDAHTAGVLFAELTARIPAGDPYVLDIAEPNAAAKSLVDRHGLREVFATARMYTGPVPVINLDWVYGVTTFELG